MSDMYNFDNNNYNNENHDGFNHYEFDENNSNTPNHKKPNAKMVKFAKKVGAIALSAVLFGGVAAGSVRNFHTDRGTGNDINKEQSSENNFQHNFKGYDGCDRHCKIRNAFYRFYHKQISSGSGKLFRNVRRT